MNFYCFYCPAMGRSVPDNWLFNLLYIFDILHILYAQPVACSLCVSSHVSWPQIKKIKLSIFFRSETAGISVANRQRQINATACYRRVLQSRRNDCLYFFFVRLQVARCTVQVAATDGSNQSINRSSDQTSESCRGQATAAMSKSFWPQQEG